MFHALQIEWDSALYNADQMKIKAFLSKYHGRSWRWYFSTPLYAARLVKPLSHLALVKLLSFFFERSSLAQERDKNSHWLLSNDQGANTKDWKILWIRLDHIGDVVMNLPALDALRRSLPDAEIDVLVLPSNRDIFADFLQPHNIITYAAPDKTRAGHKATIFETFRLLTKLRKGRYDIVFESRGDETSRMLAFLSGAQVRVGPKEGLFEIPGRPNFSFLMTHRFALEKRETHHGRAIGDMSYDETISRMFSNANHAADVNLSLLTAIGLELPTQPFRLIPSSTRCAVVKEKLGNAGVTLPFAIVHAVDFSGLIKNWTTHGFVDVVNHLTKTYGLHVLLTGAAKDILHNETLKNKTLNQALVSNIAGLFSLQELPALFEDATIMVTVDTGPMHYAALVRTPIVALMYPVFATFYAPYLQPDGVILPKNGQKKPNELGIFSYFPVSEITSPEVLKAIDKKLEKTSRSRKV